MIITYVILAVSALLGSAIVWDEAKAITNTSKKA